MGTFADFLGGLIAGERGDAEGFVKGVTKEGRARLAQERLAKSNDLALLNQAYETAKVHPETNYHLQNFMRSGLENSHLASQTGLVGAQTSDTQQNTRQKRAEQSWFQGQGLGGPQSAEHLRGMEGLDLTRRGQDIAQAQHEAQFGLDNQRFQEQMRQFGMTFGEGQRQHDVMTGLERAKTAAGLVHSMPMIPSADGKSYMVNPLGERVASDLGYPPQAQANPGAEAAKRLEAKVQELFGKGKGTSVQPSAPEPIGPPQANMLQRFGAKYGPAFNAVQGVGEEAYRNMISKTLGLPDEFFNTEPGLQRALALIQHLIGSKPTVTQQPQP